MEEPKIEFTTIEALAEHINDTLHLNFDFPFAVDGMRGSGKSTFLILLFTKLAELNGYEFDFEGNIVWNRTEMEKIIRALPEYAPIDVDEAIMAFFNREFMNKQQNNLIKLLEKARWKKHPVGFAIPNFWSLDRHIIQNYLKMRIWIKRRGLAYVFFPYLDNPFTEDKWNRRFNQEIFDIGKNKFTQSPNFYGVIKFSELDKETETKYLEVKQKRSIQADKEEFKKKQILINEQITMDFGIPVKKKFKRKIYEDDVPL